MNIQVDLVTQPIPYPAWQLPDSGTSGALAEFYGIVRGKEGQAAIVGLEYEAYTSMAASSMTRILEELTIDFPCEAAKVIHRHGPIRVGEAAIYIGLRAAHRKEAFGLLSAFMDRLKQDVPIWKTGIIT